MPIFRQNKQLWLFEPKFARKWILGSEFQKSKCRFKISTSKRPCVPIFSQNGQLWIFQPNFGRNCPITCNVLVLITLRVLQRASWRLKWAGWRRRVHGLVIPTLLIWTKNNILFSRYLYFCYFVKSTDFKICDIIIGITSGGISTSGYFFWILSTL